MLNGVAAAVERQDGGSAPYQLGQGLQFPQYDLSVGGYVSVLYSNLTEQNWKFTNRDLSLFLTKRFSSRWQLFSEVEIGNAVDLTEHTVSNDEAELDLERLYLDYRSTPALSVRIGKFLTPVGRWNQIHADPLVWTVSRPVTTTAPFARHATGAMVYGTLSLGGHDLDYNLYVDDSAQLDPTQQDETPFEDNGTTVALKNAFRRAAGARAVYHLLNDTLAVGMSYLRMDLSDIDERKALYGVDVLWSMRRTEFSGEWVYRDSLGGSETDERGGFVQAVLPVTQHLYFIGRHERYKTVILADAANVTSLGLTYRPHVAVAFKLEFRSGSGNDLIAPDGWLGSLSVLF